MTGLQEFAKRFTKFDPAICYVAVAFLIACIIWTLPVLFLRDDVLGKVIMVSAIIAITMYHRIAGIIALIVVIAMLNQNQKPIKEGMMIPTTSTALSNPLSNAVSNPLSNAVSNPLIGSSSSSSSISFKSPDEFRQKYCTKGYTDDPSGQGKPNMSYMLSPAFFTKMDATGNPQLTNDEITALQSMDPDSFSQCKPMTMEGQGGQGEQRQTIANMCDPACNWTIKPASTPTPTPTSTANAEGFTPMLRPHIRTGRRMITDGMDALKSSANRLKRQFF